jgi:hypothetical protein
LTSTHMFETVRVGSSASDSVFTTCQGSAIPCHDASWLLHLVVVGMECGPSRLLGRMQRRRPWSAEGRQADAVPRPVRTLSQLLGGPVTRVARVGCPSRPSPQ